MSALTPCLNEIRAATRRRHALWRQARYGSALGFAGALSDRRRAKCDHARGPNAGSWRRKIAAQPSLDRADGSTSTPRCPATVTCELVAPEALALLLSNSGETP